MCMKPCKGCEENSAEIELEVTPVAGAKVFLSVEELDLLRDLLKFTLGSKQATYDEDAKRVQEITDLRAKFSTVLYPLLKAQKQI